MSINLAEKDEMVYRDIFDKIINICLNFKNLKILKLSKIRSLKQLNFLSSNANIIFFNPSFNIKLIIMSFWTLLKP